MSEEKKAEHINVRVLGQDNAIVQFKIKKHTPMRKLMVAYCERSKLAKEGVRFRFDGAPINDLDTPETLEMEEGDMIEVFMPQSGGVLFPSYKTFWTEIRHKHIRTRDRVRNKTEHSARGCLKCKRDLSIRTAMESDSMDNKDEYRCKVARRYFLNSATLRLPSPFPRQMKYIDVAHVSRNLVTFSDKGWCDICTLSSL